MKSKLQWEDETEKEKSERTDKENGRYVNSKNKIRKEAFRVKGRRQWELGGQDNYNEQAENGAKESKEEGNIGTRTNLEIL
jgi:hypothetical protein